MTDYFRASDIGLNDSQNVCRVFSGPAKWNGQDGFRYMAGVCDYGEPGRYDRFRVVVTDSSGATVFEADNARVVCPSNAPNCGELDGGNIQLHRF